MSFYVESSSLRSSKKIHTKDEARAKNYIFHRENDSLDAHSMDEIYI